MIPASSARIASTGASARRVTIQVVKATTASRSGSPISIVRLTVDTASRAVASSAPACTVTSPAPAGNVTFNAANRYSAVRPSTVAEPVE